MKYLYKLYIGTEENSQEAVANAVSIFFDNFTMSNGLGRWKDENKNIIEIKTYIIEIISSEDEFSVDKVKELEKILNQKKILITKQEIKVLI